jgi:hypothetical protein
MKKKLLAVAGLTAVMLGGGVAISSQATATTAPTVSNLSATDVQDNRALARCSANPGGNEGANVWVVWKKSTQAWSDATAVQRADSAFSSEADMTTAQTVEIGLPGVDGTITDDTVNPINLPLEANTTYNYRCKTDASGYTTATDTNTITFTTGADVVTAEADDSAPIAVFDIDSDGDGVNDTSDENSPIDPTSYSISCKVNPDQGDTTKAWLVYKKSSDSWSNSAAVFGGRTEDGYVDIPANEPTDHSVTSLIHGLTPNTQYDFRCKADSSAITTVTSATSTFTTPSS